MTESGRTNREPAGPGRRRLSYANVAATLALVLAIGGGTAWAAHHYVITSTSQIKPKVLKKLHGRNGTNGTNGTNGSNGTNGKNGAVAGFLAQSDVTTAFTGTSNTTIVSKTLPAGSYVLAGSVTFTAASTSATTQFDVSCKLSDSAADTTSDTESYTGLTNFIVVIIPTNTNSITMNDAVTTTASSTAQITCTDVSNGGNTYQVKADNATLTAVQTTANS